MTSKTALECKVIEPTQTATASIIWLHGLGADYNDFLPIVDEFKLPTDANVRFVFPNAPVRPVTLNAHMPMRAWYDIYTLNDLENEDEAGINAASEQLNDLIEAEQEKGIASDNIIVAGFSQGGALALFTGLRYPKPLAGILMLSGYLPIHHQTISENANQKTPIMISHGELDDIVPLSAGEFTRDLLLQDHRPVEWKTYRMGHQICLEQVNAIRSWLKNIFQFKE